jgi:hypothetical protein
MSRVFRFLALIFLASIIVLSVLSHFDIVDAELFTFASGILAVFASVLEILANKPVGREDISVAADKLLLAYDEETLRQLKEAKEEEQKIRNFIEHRSNEVFLLKVRAYLEEAITAKYEGSEISKLISELEEVESQLDALQVQYGSVELPARFKMLLSKLNEEQRFDAYLELLNSFPELPLIPVKKMYIAALKLFFTHRHQLRGVLPGRRRDAEDSIKSNRS